MVWCGEVTAEVEHADVLGGIASKNKQELKDTGKNVNIQSLNPNVNSIQNIYVDTRPDRQILRQILHVTHNT